MSKTFDIYVMGKTGTGKSTLINTVLENDVAPIGKGEAVTRENICYTGKTALQNSNYVLNLWDTVGLEINEKITEETIEKLKKQIETDCSDGNGGLSVVWFCVNQRCKRLESYEIQLIRRISFAQEIPFVIVMTQCLSEDDTELECIVKGIVTFRNEDYLILEDPDTKELFTVKYIEDSSIEGYLIENVDESIERIILSKFGG